MRRADTFRVGMACGLRRPRQWRALAPRRTWTCSARTRLATRYNKEVPRVRAERELVASLEDAWNFVAEPHHLSDWWPGLGAVEPDRRGLARGARWVVRGSERPSLLRAGSWSGLLVVLDVEPPHRFHFRLHPQRIDVELRLEAAGPDRTEANLTVTAPWLVGLTRSFPQKALERLHALCQTAANL
jgi:uncharacterized protein YndB with AHSA1/START domain